MSQSSIRFVAWVEFTMAESFWIGNVSWSGLLSARCFATVLYQTLFR
jgi:hypothetical protein